MAAEEVNKPPPLPQYPEMIFEAIDGLKEKSGSNKSSISRYIESTYGDLPVGHSQLLAHNLDKMKRSGEIVMIKNNYMRPDPNAPPRRGRGRPPKPKPEGVAATAAPSSPRPRGRPPKAKDPADVGASRPRGRPPKEGGSPAASPAKKAKTGTGRGRGRPPKVRAEVPVAGFD